MALTQQRSATQPASGAWTYDDLLALPDDGRRWEIIEGVLHEMPGPSWMHQLLVAGLLRFWFGIADSVGATVVGSPVDVFFPGASPVQPDILLLLPSNPATVSKRGLEGAPDLVVEILSPSTRGHDALTKRALYARAGVREYWLVDPDSRTVEVLRLVDDAFHLAQRAGERDTAASLLLPGAALDVAALFARLETGPRPE